MGLGKTLEMIALIVSDLASSNDKKTTLIVAPLGIMSNWSGQARGPDDTQWTACTDHFLVDRSSRSPRITFASLDIPWRRQEANASRGILCLRCCHHHIWSVVEFLLKMELDD